jgi:hypothetical protein
LGKAPAIEVLDHQQAQNDFDRCRGAPICGGGGKAFEEVRFDGLKEYVIVQERIHLRQNRIHPHA